MKNFDNEADEAGSVDIEVSGIDRNDFRAKSINEALDRFLKKVENYQVQSLKAHVKTIHSSDKRILYSLKAHAVTDSGVFAASSETWDLVEVFRECLGKLEKELKKRSGKK